MKQIKEHKEPIRPPIRKNKNFVYNGEKYSIDFSLIKKYSKYFYNNKNTFKSIDDIELRPDNYELTDDAIRMFISCCQNEPFDITDSNIFSLHRLSIQYEVPELNKCTTEYISKNKKQLIFQSISYKIHNQNSKVKIDLADEENMIAANFFDFINNAQLLSLPIQILYRIINNDQIQFKSMNSTELNQFIEFLFKCLDKYGREASVLFSNFDLDNERVDILSRLLTNYSNTFDFNFINPKELAKRTSSLLSDFEKLKIEYSNKLIEMQQENQKQREFFIASQKSFEDYKNELLSINQKMEQRFVNFEKEQKNQLSKMQECLNEQNKKLERYIKIKVKKIEINADQNFLKPGSTITLTASIQPALAFNHAVEWKVNQKVEGTVEIETKNEEKLVLKCLKAACEKVTIVASALDGSGITATKDIIFGCLTGTIDINVLSDQSIKGVVRIKGEGGVTLDRSRSKYVLNSDNSEKLGESAYNEGSQLDDLVTEVSFNKPKGKYYMHVLLVDNFGHSNELISPKLVTKGFCLSFGYTGRIESVDLESGSYKLEAWGAQGGSANETYHGGYGGYSTGTITLHSKTKLFVVVGGSSNSTQGGYNGGGSGGIFDYGKGNLHTAFGGGGASHIGLKSSNLSSFSSDYSSQLLIAASGGGGSTDGTGRKNAGYKTYYFSTGGSGGGITGGDGISADDSSRSATGGTQTSSGKNNYCDWSERGSFGQGSNCESHPDFILGGGGGSGFYGGGSGGCGGPGGGGSGFINTSKLADAHMCGFNVPTSLSLESKTLATSNVSDDAVSDYAKKGDGYVKITSM